MRRNQYLYMVLLLILVSACQPGLMVPSTPNIPYVDSTRTKALKIGLGLTKAEVQYNRLTEDNRLFQLQASQHWIGGFGRSVLQVGWGQMKYWPNSVKTYSVFGSGFSSNRLLDFHTYPTLDEILSGSGAHYTIDIESYQIPFFYQYTSSKTWKQARLACTLKPQFVYGFSTKMGNVANSIYLPENQVVTDLNVPHSFYGTFDMSVSLQQYRFGLVFGAKIPLFVSHPEFRDVNIVQDDLYLRWTFRLSK